MKKSSNTLVLPNRKRASYRKVKHFVLPILCISLFMSGGILAQGKFIVDKEFSKGSLHTQSSYFLDVTGDLKFDEIQSLSEENWKYLGDRSPSFGYIPTPVWFRVDIKFQDPKDEFYFLRVNYPSLDTVQLIIIDNTTGEVIYNRIQGDRFNFSERILPSHVFSYPIVPEKNSDWTIYIRAQTTASLSVPFDLFAPDAFYEEETDVYLLFGMYFGLILAMFFYNFVVYVYTKEKVFVYYLFYLMSYFLLIFSGFGFASRYWYPDSIFLNNNLFIISVSFNAFASILFSIAFLKIRNYFPGFYKFILFCLVGVAAWIGIYLMTSWQVLYNLIGVFSFIPQISILITAIFLFKKYEYARYFVFAWTFYLVMYGISVFRLIGILPSNFITYYGIQIGSAVEMLVLSFAIGHRLYEYKRKSDKLSGQILEERDRTNKELTNLIQEKTLEIQNNYKLLEKDIEMARNMQLSTIPKNIDWSNFGLDVGTFFLPKDQVSGDIYDLCQFDEDRLRIFIADATGHGIQAGFFTMSIRTEYERIKYQHSDTSQVLRMLNQSVFQTFGNETMLYSCFLIDIDLTQGFFVYSSAGHPEQYLYQNKEIIEMKSLGPILGFKKDMIIKSQSIPIEKDFKLLLFTDGITEVHDKDMNEFGGKRLIEKLKVDNSARANDLLYELYSDAIAFSPDSGLEDDVTMLYIRGKK